MAKIEIKSAFVEEHVGNPAFVLKIAEPHSRQDENGNWQTVARTFFDVKVGRESGINLADIPKGSRVSVTGTQKTEVREHQGKKFYSLVVWADQITPVQAPQGGFGGGSPQSAPQGQGHGFAPATAHPGFDAEAPF